MYFNVLVLYQPAKLLRLCNLQAGSVIQQFCGYFAEPRRFDVTCPGGRSSGCVPCMSSRPWVKDSDSGVPHTTALQFGGALVRRSQRIRQSKEGLTIRIMFVVLGYVSQTVDHLLSLGWWKDLISIHLYRTTVIQACSESWRVYYLWTASLVRVDDLKLHRFYYKVLHWGRSYWVPIPYLLYSSAT